MRTASAGRRLASAALLALAVAAAPSLARARVEVVGQMHMYQAAYEDTLAELGRKYGLGYTEIRAANPDVDPWLPGAGTQIVLPTAHLLPDAPQSGIIINLTGMRIFYFRTPGAAPETYPIGIGREGRDTPIGTTRIARKQERPTWRPPASVRKEKPWLPAVVPPGPDNPLGEYAMYLGWDRYLIHGTNTPYGVGRRLSAGCIRMYPEDIERLFPEVPVGTKVTVVDQDVLFGWIDGELYMEAHPTKRMADLIEFGEPIQPEMPEGLVERAQRAAGAQAGRLDLEAVRTAGLERRGYPVRITR